MDHYDVTQVTPKPQPVSTTSGETRSVKDRNLLSGSLSFKLRESQRKSQGSVRSKERNAFVNDFLNTHEAWASESGLPNSGHDNSEKVTRNCYHGFPSLRKTRKSTERKVGLGGLSTREVSVKHNSDIDGFSDLMSTEKSCYKAAMDAVRVTNVGGVFLPLDKYAAGRFTKHSGISPTPSGDAFLLRPDGTWHREGRQGRKTRYQSRSAKSDGALLEKESQVRRNEQFNTNTKIAPNCTISPKKVCFGPKNCGVDYVGLHWKVTSQPNIINSYQSPKAHGRVSRNVLPVTIGVDYRGTSVSKTRWAVPAMQNHEGTEVWFRGLNFVKQCVVDGTLSKCR